METPINDKKNKGKGPNTLRKDKQQTVYKLYLDSPFKPTWPSIVGEAAVEITQELDKHQCTPRPPRPNNGKIEDTESSRSIVPRAWIVSGINAVTKAMERDQVDLILICKSGPELLTRHMLLLAHSKSIKICACNSFSKTLGGFIGAPSAAAVGIRKVAKRDSKNNHDVGSQDEERNFKHLFEFLTARAKMSDSNWIPVEPSNNNPKSVSRFVATKILRRGSASKNKKKKTTTIINKK